jgi:membrane-anchored protein YejM (alkaline phosphatase superfamily)
MKGKKLKKNYGKIKYPCRPLEYNNNNNNNNIPVITGATGTISQNYPDST